MKKITYIENVFNEGLLQRILLFKNTVQWHQNSTGRSEITDDISSLDKNLFNDIILTINRINNIEIEECDLLFYRRHTKQFNPHIDRSKYNFLVYLDGGIHSIENGTIFFSDNMNKNLSVNIANVFNSGIFFPGNYWHTTAQSIYNNTDVRVTLNCFIYSCKSKIWEV